jgi:hypothetical protein
MGEMVRRETSPSGDHMEVRYLYILQYDCASVQPVQLRLRVVCRTHLSGGENHARFIVGAGENMNGRMVVFDRK